MLDNKIAVITGGGQGIGRAIALACASAGANVVLASRSEEALHETRTEVERMGREALVIPTDITQEASVRNLADRALAHFGRVDILVNNSGVTGPVKPLWEVTLDEWQATFDINVTGAFLCCRAFLPSMIERRTGSIIFIASMTGKRPLYGRTTYGAGKLALVGMARTLAWETGPYNIRVKVISPGAVAGERLERVFRTQAEVEHTSVDEARRKFTETSPLHRLVSPSDIADAVVFLASDRAASITGEDLNVSAGTVM